MKVVVVSHTYMTALSQEKMQVLAEKVTKLLVITPEKFKDTLRTITVESLPNAKFKLIGVKSYFNQHHSLRIYNNKHVKKIFNEFKPDLVLIEQEPFSLSTYQIMRFKNKFKFKVLIFSFQNIFKNYPPPFSWAEKYCLNNMDFFLAGSSSVLPVWLKKGVAGDKAAVIPQVGVNLLQFFPSDLKEAKKRFQIHKFAFAYAGRFVEEKGIHILIKAFSIISKENNCELILIGSGPYENKIKALIQSLNLESQVRIISGIKHHEMPTILNAIDVLVLPSIDTSHWKEQFGHILIEAMACKKPVIGSDNEAIIETIGEAGLIFKMGNANDLADKMTSIFKDPQFYSQVATKALERVKQFYTNSKIVDQLVHYFKLVLNQK